MIPRIFDEIFERIKESANNLEFMIKVSFMEIYKEKIRDLTTGTSNPFVINFLVLLDSSSTLLIREDKTKGIYVEDLNEIYVSCKEDVIKIITKGNELRKVASTSTLL